MKIILNDQTLNLSDSLMNIAEFLSSQSIPLGGTAVAVNNRLITRSNWELTFLKDGDVVTVISAAFGG